MPAAAPSAWAPRRRSRWSSTSCSSTSSGCSARSCSGAPTHEHPSEADMEHHDEHGARRLTDDEPAAGDPRTADEPRADGRFGADGPHGDEPLTADDLRRAGAPAREALERGGVAVRGGAPAGEEDEYQWHTGLNRPTGVPDAIEFIDVHKAFGRNKILRGLNMGIPDGKISMILGPSGTGKSVCIKHMVGLLYPDQGDVLVHGESVPNMEDDELFGMRKKFGVLFQDGALFGSMNLYDNVAFPLRQHTDKGEDEIGEIVNGRLNEVGLGGAHDKLPNEL